MRQFSSVLQKQHGKNPNHKACQDYAKAQSFLLFIKKTLRPPREDLLKTCWHSQGLIRQQKPRGGEYLKNIDLAPYASQKFQEY